MLGKTEMPSGFTFGWLWMPRVRTEQPYGSPTYNLLKSVKREILHFPELEKWNFKTEEQLSLQISVHLVQVQAFLALWGSGWSPSSVQASVSTTRHICQDGTFVRLAPDGRSQEHLKRLLLDCWLFISGSSHLI